jgi:D-sedoheptulose 7-phosphate isomerase
MGDTYRKLAGAYLADIHELLQTIEADLIEQLDNLASLLARARMEKKTIFTMGNGGSAATASHIAEDIAKGTITEHKPRFRVIGLADSIPSMLAWANDSCYEDIFIEQLKNLMEPGDIVIGISGSGNSENVVRAIKWANANGGLTVGISGYDGGRLMKNARENIHVPSRDMQKVEDLHLMLLHVLFRLLRDSE